MAESTGINYEQIASVALDMLSSGVKITVRGVMKITGGKTETVSRLLNDFYHKRDAEVLKMAGELGSSAIASLLASEIQLIVDKKTKALSEIVERQKGQISEMVELLDEKESECKHRTELSEAKSLSSINDSIEKIKAATDRIKIAETAKSNSEQELSKIKIESDALVQAAEQKSSVLVDSSKSEADALVQAANKQIDKAEFEAKTLRQQVKELSVDQARHEIEQAQFEQAKTTINKSQIEIAEQKILVVKLQTEQNAFVKDTNRLESDLVSAKDNANKLSQAQAQLVELQKQLSQSQYDLSQSESEKVVLTQALSASSK